MPKLPDFGIEYTRQRRDPCAECKEKFEKGEIRITKVVYEINQKSAYDGMATWYHVPCFARSRHELGWLQSAESFPGFRRLFEEDKVTVMTQIP